MLKSKKNYWFLTLTLIYLLRFSNVLAIPPGPDPGISPPPGHTSIDLPDSPASGFSEFGFVGQIISKFLPIILGLAGFVTVIIIIISGIQFITSGGNPEAAAAARGRLTFAIIGFIIIILAFAILQIVDKLLLGGTGVV